MTHVAFRAAALALSLGAVACRRPATIATPGPIGPNGELRIEDPAIQERRFVDALAFAVARSRATATALDPAAGFPRSTDTSGKWTVRRATGWTSGFFPGTLWLLYQHTGDPALRAQAERWTAPLEVMDSVSNTHDLGFVLMPSFGRGYALTHAPHDSAVLIQGATQLARRFNPAVGAIKSWDTERQKDRRGAWRFPVIIDNMMNLELLFWAAKHGGDPSLGSIAERHALTSARTHLRADGSVAHVALFDPVTGAFLGHDTWQGYDSSSAWARGQAWAIYGFTAAYRETNDATLLAAARRAADFYVAHLPPDGVPYWDFRDPGIPNVERDASAGAIAASGLLELSTIVGGTKGQNYRVIAEHALRTLADHYLSRGTPAQSILLHSVGGHPQHDELDVGISYADYYFVEALLRRNGELRVGSR
jgi:hypothetical protein